MRERRAYRQPRRALARWLGFLLLAGAMLAAAQYAMHRHVAQLRASSPWTYLKAAERALNENHPKEALAALEHATKLDDSSPIPFERMGRIYYGRLSDWKHALDAFRAAIERGSRDEDVRGKTLWSLIHLGRYKDAAEFGRLCLNDGFESPDFYRYIGEAYRRAGMNAESIPFFEKAVHALPDDMLMLERLHDAYGATGQTDRQREIKRRMEKTEG